MKKDPKIFLKDILKSTEKIEKYTHKLTRKEFFQKDETQDAVIKRLEIIGEAVKNIPGKIRNKYSIIPWKKVAGMRDILIHEYFGINLERVWTTIKKDLPKLKKQIEKILEKTK